MKGKSRLLWLMLPASFGALYFPAVVGIETNIVTKDILLMLPLQIAALAYVCYRYYRKPARFN